jgi:hypothetical protein
MGDPPSRCCRVTGGTTTKKGISLLGYRAELVSKEERVAEANSRAYLCAVSLSKDPFK